MGAKSESVTQFASPELPRNHVCNLCQKRFLKVQHLNDHVNRHFGAKPHQCNLCEKKYTSQFSLKSHKVWKLFSYNRSCLLPIMAVLLL